MTNSEKPWDYSRNRFVYVGNWIGFLFWKDLLVSCLERSAYNLKNACFLDDTSLRIVVGRALATIILAILFLLLIDLLWFTCHFETTDDTKNQSNTRR